MPAHAGFCATNVVYFNNITNNWLAIYQLANNAI